MDDRPFVVRVQIVYEKRAWKQEAVDGGRGTKLIPRAKTALGLTGIISCDVTTVRLIRPGLHKDET
jgi:hypothetical protein